MMIAPDIRDSSEEDRRKYINDRYPCISDCDMCGLCKVFLCVDNAAVFLLFSRSEIPVCRDESIAIYLLILCTMRSYK